MKSNVNSFLDKKISSMGSFLKGFVAPLLENEAKTNAYWKDRSSNARNGIKGGAEGSGKSFTLYLAHGAEYGEWLENGTGIYGPTGKPIVPVNAKILSWVDQSGQRHFAKSVRGIPKMPILKNTLMDNKETIAQAIVKHFEE